MGTPHHKRGRRSEEITDKRRARIKRLWSEGITIKEIVFAVALPRDQVEAEIRKMGLPVRRTGKAAENGGQQRLLDVLTKAAAQRRISPTTHQLATLLEAPYMTVQGWFNNLIKTGLIRSQKVIHSTKGSMSVLRVVTIIKTGRKTADPRPHNALYNKNNQLSLLDQSKNFIRSRGPVVYNASVKSPGMAGIFVDQRLMSEDEVVELARHMGFHNTP